MRTRTLLAFLLVVSGIGVARADKPRTDVHGDPLPKGAVARLGSVRFQHGGYVRGLAFSPEGKRIASLGYSSQGTRGLVIWDSQTGQAVKRIDTPGSNGLSVDWSPGGNSLVFADSSQAVYIVNIHTQKRRKIKVGSYCYRVEFSTDGNSVFAAARDGVYQFRRRDGKRIRKWGKAAVSVSMGGKYLAAANSRYNKRKGRPIELYNLETGKKVHELAIKKKRFMDVAVSSDGNYVVGVVSGYGRRGVKLPVWQTGTGKKLRDLKVNTRYVRRAEFIPGTHRLVTLGMKGDVEVIDVETGKRHKRMDITDGSVRAMALSANGKYVAAGGHNQRISVYDLQKGKPTYKQVGHSRRVTNIAFSPDSSRLVSASYDKTVRVWDLETSRTRHVLRGHSSYAYNVDWSDDGKRVASVQLSGSTVAILWDPETGKKVRQIDNVPSHAMDLVFRNDGKEVVIAGRKGGVKAYDTESGKSVYRVSVDTDGRRSYFYTVALSPNGRMFAAFGRQYLKLMDLDTKTAYTLPTNERIMYGHQNASFSPDGYLMAWSGVGQTHVIETISGREVMGFDRGKGRRNAVTFSADGRYLAVSHKSDNIDVYDLARGKRVARYGGHGDGGSGRRNYSRYGTSCLRFSPNGNMLASGGGKGTVLIWDFASAVSDQRDTEDSIDLEACWDDLANHDARRAYTAFWKLSRHGEEAAAFLADAMQPVAKPEQERIQRNIDSLDAEGYQARKQAYAELARFGPVVKREIRKALKGDLSLAGRRRLQELLRVMDSPTSRSPAVLRQLRAVRILRNVGGEQARKVLVSLTRGVKEAPQTQAARRALKLLRRTEGE